MIVGIAALITMMTAIPRDARAEGNEHRVIVGLATTSADVTQSWHVPNTTQWSSLDLGVHGAATAGTNVLWQSYNVSNAFFGAETLKAIIQPYSSPASCTGHQVGIYRVWIDEGQRQVWFQIAKFWFVHINQGLFDGFEFFIYPNSNWTFQNIGTVRDPEVSTCQGPTTWTGPHLHQGADDLSPGNQITTNTGIPMVNPVSPNTCRTFLEPDNPAVPWCYITPTGDWENRWMHKLTW